VTILYIFIGLLALIGLLAVCFVIRRFLATIKYILDTPKVVDEFINGKR
jgi:hypothetical protein